MQSIKSMLNIQLNCNVNSFRTKIFIQWQILLFFLYLYRFSNSHMNMYFACILESILAFERRLWKFNASVWFCSHTSFRWLVSFARIRIIFHQITRWYGWHGEFQQKTRTHVRNMTQMKRHWRNRWTLNCGAFYHYIKGINFYPKTSAAQYVLL